MVTRHSRSVLVPSTKGGHCRIPPPSSLSTPRYLGKYPARLFLPPPHRGLAFDLQDTCRASPAYAQGLPVSPPPSRPSRHLGLVVHLQGTAAADARLAPPASHHSGMAGHTAACSENALGSVPVSRVVVGAVAAVSSVGTEGGMGVHTTQYVQR